MDELKIDRRVRKTKKVLLDALTKLMSEKKINSITVKELTDLADVNRSTFYLYYRDIYDMVEKIESEMLDEFTDAYNKFSKKATTHENLFSFLVYLFEFVQSNAGICKILLGPDGDYTFLEKFKEAIKCSQPPIDNANIVTKSYYFMAYVISGCVGIIQQWLNDDMNVPPEDMAEIVMELLKQQVPK